MVLVVDTFPNRHGRHRIVSVVVRSHLHLCMGVFLLRLAETTGLVFQEPVQRDMSSLFPADLQQPYFTSRSTIRGKPLLGRSHCLVDHGYYTHPRLPRRGRRQKDWAYDVPCDSRSLRPDLCAPNDDSDLVVICYCEQRAGH